MERQYVIEYANPADSSLKTKNEKEFDKLIKSEFDHCLISDNDIRHLEDYLELENKRLQDMYKRCKPVTIHITKHPFYENMLIISVNGNTIAYLKSVRPTPSYFNELVDLNKMIDEQ